MLAETNKDLARCSWELMDNLDLIDEVYAPISSGTNPIKTSRA